MNIERTPIYALVLMIAATPLGLAASGSYIGGTGDLVVICDTEDPTGHCLGGQTFNVAANPVNATIEINDDVIDSTGGYYIFQDANGNDLSEGPFCDTTTQPVPNGAADLVVFVDEAFGPLDCSTPPGTATTGNITVTFS